MDWILKVAEKIENDEFYQGEVWWDETNGEEHAPCVIIRLLLEAGAIVVDIEREWDYSVDDFTLYPVLKYQGKIYQSVDFRKLLVEITNIDEKTWAKFEEDSIEYDRFQTADELRKLFSSSI